MAPLSVACDGGNGSGGIHLPDPVVFAIRDVDVAASVYRHATRKEVELRLDRWTAVPAESPLSRFLQQK